MRRLHVVTEGTADNLQVKDHRQEHPVSPDVQLGDIRHPFYSGLFGVKLPIQDMVTDRESVVTMHFLLPQTGQFLIL
jgi:hypothetical protein